LFIGVSSTSGNQLIKVIFTDITTKAGINFKHASSVDKRYLVESMIGGVGHFD
jgi:hypothetical protein